MEMVFVELHELLVAELKKRGVNASCKGGKT